ncbi:MAG: reverse transcriptase domain-containing protein [Sorangiineae bacterium]|nr:reverse transcriptase domain-containing protein [Sorangiineae bacterium]
MPVRRGIMRDESRGVESALGRLRELVMRAARGKRRSPEVAMFLLDVAPRLDALAEELATHRYLPSRGRAFWIEEPKRRRIFALPFRDRVAQHLLIDATLPALERWFAPQSYACRRGKGTHRALRRAGELFRVKRFALRLDVRKFFPSIDHAHLRELLDPLTPPGWRWLRDVFIDAPVECERVAWYFRGDDLFTPHARPHGLPIGSLTSQIWANAYLTPLDHLLTGRLGLGTFVRYSDDLVVFDDDPGRLRDALAALAERAEQLRLRLHPGKTRLHRTTDPIAFLGFVFRRTGDGLRVHLRRENVQRFRARMATTRALFEVGALEPEDVVAQLRAWLAHARHGHTRALCERELARLRF